MQAWPTEIKVKNQGRTLSVAFDNGQQGEISAELLRVESPSAEVKGHGPGQEVLVAGKQYVAITAVEPVGTYAIRLIFSDGHSTGIYTWKYLERLGLEGAKIFADYESKLKQAGLARS